MRSRTISHAGAMENHNIQITRARYMNTITTSWNNTPAHIQTRISNYDYYASAIYVDSRGVYVSVELFSTGP